MKTIDDYLNQAKEKLGSDYAVAKHLKVSRQAVSTWRKRGSLDNENAFKLAQLIGVSPLEIIAAGEVSKNPEKANFWAKWGAVAGVIMAVIADQLFFNNQSVTANALTALFIPYANYCVAALIIALVWYLWSIHSSSQKAYRSC